MPSVRPVLCAVFVLFASALLGPLGCGGRVTHEPTEQESDEVATYAPPTTYMCQAFVPEGGCSDCLAQALEGPCGELRIQCDGSGDCVTFGQCQFECYENTSCCESCAETFPVGFTLYAEYIDCVVCDVCADVCAGLFPTFCGGT
jgi:hypothetical protein